MRKLTLHLPKYRLSIEYKLIKRRKSRFEEPFLPTRTKLNKKYRVGNIFHKFLRHVFEHKSVKKIFGANMALMLVASTFTPATAGLSEKSFAGTNEPESVVISENNIPLTTTKSIQNPVENVSITQGYRFYHPGIDLDGITGDPIKPIKNGVVINVDYSRFAYGNSVIVDHGEGITTLYAHLSTIAVAEGQTVTTSDEIGKMGATGRSFGDHLHLEVRENGVPVNPLNILPR